MIVKARLAGRCDAATDWRPQFFNVTDHPTVEVHLPDNAPVIDRLDVDCAGKRVVTTAYCHQGKYYAVAAGGWPDERRDR